MSALFETSWDDLKANEVLVFPKTTCQIPHICEDYVQNTTVTSRVVANILFLADCEGKSEALETIVGSIATLIEGIAKENTPEETVVPRAFTQRKTPFHCRVRPTISIKDYLMRLITMSGRPLQYLIIALILLDRLNEISSPIKIDNMNAHRYIPNLKSTVTNHFFSPSVDCSS